MCGSEASVQSYSKRGIDANRCAEQNCNPLITNTDVHTIYGFPAM